MRSAAGKTMIFSRRLCVIGAAIVGSMALTAPVFACLTTVNWVALMSAPTAKYSAKLGKSGTAEMKFDWLKPYGTIVVKTRNVRNVTSIELREIIKPRDTSGPFITSIYSQHDAPYNGQVTKVLTAKDILPQNPPTRSGYLSLADAMVHQRVAVVVCTRSKPNGEIAGVIAAHPVLIYSGRGGVHDAKLHHPPRLGGI